MVCEKLHDAVTILANKHVITHGFPGISCTFISFSFLFLLIQAVDIFAGSLSSPEKRFYVAGEIARILGVPYQGETVQRTDKPIIQAWFYSFVLQKMSYSIFIWSMTSNLQARHTELQVGRVTLQCSDKPVNNHALLNTYIFVRLSFVW
jgi:hypothetical protein